MDGSAFLCPCVLLCPTEHLASMCLWWLFCSTSVIWPSFCFFNGSSTYFKVSEGLSRLYSFITTSFAPLQGLLGCNSSPIQLSDFHNSIPCHVFLHNSFLPCTCLLWDSRELVYSLLSWSPLLDFFQLFSLLSILRIVRLFFSPPFFQWSCIHLCMLTNSFCLVRGLFQIKFFV